MASPSSIIEVGDAISFLWFKIASPVTRFQSTVLDFKSQLRLVQSKIKSQLRVAFQSEITVQSKITSRIGTNPECFCPDLYSLGQASRLILIPLSLSFIIFAYPINNDILRARNYFKLKVSFWWKYYNSTFTSSANVQGVKINTSQM